MLNQQKISVIIVAAGNGTRFGTNKLFLRLGKSTVLALSVKAFLQDFVDEIIVVCNHQTLERAKQHLHRHFPKEKRLQFILGGHERWESSLLGIKAATGEVVLIHDAARPLVSRALIKETAKQAITTGACLLAAPATDSIKLANDQGLNHDALDRRQVWLAQTPQAFHKPLILKAYQKALDANYQQMTDESELITHFLKKKVTIVASTPQNLKITFPPDLEVAKLYLRQTT